MTKDIDVLIIGAGPTGLMLALLLKQQGIAIRLIDKRTTPILTSNALAVQTRTLEMFDELNLLQELFASGYIIRGMEMYASTACLTKLDFSLLENTCYPFVLGLSQHEMEVYLIQQLKLIDQEVERGVELVQLYNKKNQVQALVRNQDGAQSAFSAHWAVACDGGHSAVREQMGLSFDGKELKQHFILADVETDFETSIHRVQAFLHPEGPLLLIRYSEQCIRIIVEVTSDAALKKAVNFSEQVLTELLKERLPFPLPIKKVIWTSGFWIHERLISSYKQDHVFFAGDAAHIHSPVGGQGMNTGLQDAYNLAWKLAYVIRDHAPETLLNTYEIERRIVAKKLLRMTSFLTEIVTLHHPMLIRIRNFGLQQLFKLASVRKKMAMNMTELAISYPANNLVHTHSALSSTIKAGTRFLNVQIEKRFLLDYIRGHVFSLLIFCHQAVADITLLTTFKKNLERNYPSLINYVLIEIQGSASAMWRDEIIIDDQEIIHKTYQINEPCIYLIRPDKYIGLTCRLHELIQIEDYFAKNLKII